MENKSSTDSIQEVIDIIEESIRTRDYGSMASRISKALNTEQSELYDRVKEQYPGNKYRGGHMANAYPQQSAAAKRARESVAARQEKLNAQQGNSRPVAARAEDPYYTSHPTWPGLLMKVLGITGTAAFGIGFLFMRALSSIPFFRVMSMTPLIFLILSVILLVFGVLKEKKASRFAKYKEVLGKKFYAAVSKLAQAVGRSESATAKELKKMSDEGWFRQGHLDEGKTTFMATDELYEHYKASMESAAQREAELSAIPPAARAILERGNDYIQKIEDANTAIPDIEISDKLSRMQKIVTRIFAEVRKRPESAKNLNMLMDYYLPTTEKLMDAYVEMDAQPVQGENITTAKQEIAASLDVVNEAFETLLDGFFKDQAMDVSTDISVMKTVMKQQGLTQDELTAFRKKQELGEGPTLAELKEQIKEAEKEAVASPVPDTTNES